MTDNNLRAWIDDRLAGVEPAASEGNDEVSLRGWIDDALAGRDEAPAEGDEEVDDEEAAAFYGALSDTDRERALVDADYRQQLYDEWAGGDDDDDEEESDAEAEDEEEGHEEPGPIDIPTSGADRVQMAYEREKQLLANGWESVDDFLVLAASDARWWMEAADAMGWPREARPGSRDLPQHLAMAVIAAGVPGAKLRPSYSLNDAPIGGSKRRLW